jgi:hypothetical protein
MDARSGRDAQQTGFTTPLNKALLKIQPLVQISISEEQLWISKSDFDKNRTIN